MSALELVIDLPFLASEINSAHREITVHARGMLLEAKRAGDALLAAKRKVRHGEFKTWVEANCRCSYETANRYCRVAKIAATKNVTLDTFDGGLAAFLEAHAKPRVAPPSPTPSFTERDAERVLNIAARVERGEGAEKAVAASKLAEVAQANGTTPEALLERSMAMCPDREKSAYSTAVEAEVSGLDAKIAEVEARIEAFKKREALIERLMDHSKQELVEMLADRMLAASEDYPLHQGNP